MPPPDPGVQRNFYTTSSRGVRGEASLDAVRPRTRLSPAADPLTLTPAMLAALPERLRDAQRVFDSTGGLHAAGACCSDGTLLVVSCVLMVSGRASLELVQKAVWPACRRWRPSPA